jgi:hypothetical protein
MAAAAAPCIPARPPAASTARRRRGSLPANRGLLIAAALSLGAGLVHLEVTKTHWFVWWGYGLFFLLSGIGQLLYAAALVRWPKPGVLWLGIVANLAIVAMYGYTRTNGVPWGPAAGHIERVGSGDFITTAGEFALAGMLISALGPRTRSRLMTALALAGVAVWALRLTNNLL